MNTVEGKKDESCLLTLHFTTSSFMIAFKKDTNNSKSIIHFFNDIYEKLGRELFMKLFPIILTDNGTEFSNPCAIEFDKEGLRKIHPKGHSWNSYTQRDINLMTTLINSYARETINNKSSHLLLKTLYGKEVLNIFNVTYIETDDINLTPSLISK